MPISRRKFAKTVGATVIGAVVAGTAGKTLAQTATRQSTFVVPGEAFADRIMVLQSEAFLPYVGTVFYSTQSKTRNTLQLTDVVPFNPSKKEDSGPVGERFSLIFRVLGNGKPGTELHTFDHASLGTFSLFIAPVERGRLVYEAVINHALA